MKTFWPIFALSISVAWSGSVVCAPSITPQSLAGEWEYALNPQLVMKLHLHVDAGGVLSGSIDTPDNPPKHMELTNVQLKGNVLSYKTPQGTVQQVVMADGKTMVGSYQWQRVEKSSLSSQQLAGDYAAVDANGTGTIMRLRAAADGALTGSFDVVGKEVLAGRRPLKNVSFDGKNLSFVDSNDSVFHGTVINGGKAISGSFQAGTAPIVWHQTRDAAQAALADAAERPRPTDGTWAGNLVFAKVPPETAPNRSHGLMTFIFGSNPDSCLVIFGGDFSSYQEKAPCVMKLTGHAVHVVMSSRQSTFDGTLSVDGQHLSGTYTSTGPSSQRYGPGQIEMVPSKAP